MPAAKRRAASKVDLGSHGARVLSVFGAFNSRVLIEMPADKAADLFPEGLGSSGRTHVVEAVERDIAALRERAPELAGSTLAASALALAYELQDPYNSATSKSMCAKALMEAMATLRELAPPKEAKDGVDRVAEQRAKRRSGLAGASDPAGS